jgi:hypothetical protein
MISTRVKRAFLALGLFIAVVLVAAFVLAYMLSRDVAFDWENPNALEAKHFNDNLQRFERAVANGQHGYVKFSQLEMNSYIRQALTNTADTNAPGLHLSRVAVGLANTNLNLYSWGEYRVLSVPLKFVVQRTFSIQQEGTNVWEMPLESFKVGEVEVPRDYWNTVASFLEPMDAPVKESFAWRTNIPALLVTKNVLSQRPELRLFTYKPVAPEDLR